MLNPYARPPQPACPQLHSISVVLPASLQESEQYLSPSRAGQVQIGWAHFFWSAMFLLRLYDACNG